MLQPKRVRYRRPQDGRGNKGNAHRGTQLAFGSFGIKTLDAKWIDSRQIEAARVAINRYMNREGQVWIRIFPDKPITRKPADVRMGKGKGDPAGWVIRYAQMLEGNVRNTGVHACGVIISPDKVSNRVPVSTADDKETGEKLICTQYEGSVIEETCSILE